ncbi:MAG TPA: hypothetical protein VHS31_15615 [Tepidisphaeraceae bacterium]|jgi:hypothetical protein|nr:hypothetical protein [Tepidisphaeraceae bacterium]
MNKTHSELKQIDNEIPSVAPQQPTKQQLQAESERRLRIKLAGDWGTDGGKHAVDE